MADKKMNDFATASDGAYIYAESASGEQIKISKADLASVVAGLIKFPKKKTIMNYNTLEIELKQGLYSVVDSTNNKAWIFTYDGSKINSIIDNLTGTYNKYSGGSKYYIENHTGSHVEFHIYSFV